MSPAFTAKPPATTSTVHDMASMVWRLLERGYRGRQPDTSEWGADVDRGFMLGGDELAQVLREANEARAELRAGATLAEALGRAESPADALGAEEPPLAPWFDMPPPAPAQRPEGEDGEEAEAAPARGSRITFLPGTGKRRGAPPKLTDDQVREIRAARRLTTVRALAEKYRVSAGTINGICSGSMRWDVPARAPAAGAARTNGAGHSNGLLSLVPRAPAAPAPRPPSLREAKRTARMRALFLDWLARQA